MKNKYCLVRHVGQWEVRNGKTIIHGMVDFQEVIHIGTFSDCFTKEEALENGQNTIYESNGKWYSYSVIPYRIAKLQGLA